MKNLVIAVRKMTTAKMHLPMLEAADRAHGGSDTLHHPAARTRRESLSDSYIAELEVWFPGAGSREV